jgi:hypothetical protein
MGNWSNIQEMEATLTLEELYLLIDAMRRREHEHKRFLGLLQGVDIDEGKEEAEFERIKMKAEADLAGKSEEEFTFESIGIVFESDDDD